MQLAASVEFEPEGACYVPQQLGEPHAYRPHQFVVPKYLA